MKANRKFIRGDEEAVSPVIAVILMVAITVVLAATVYVWVSGFGSNSSKPANTMALTTAGAIYDCDGTGGDAVTCKQYVIASASPGLKWSDMIFTLDGGTQTNDGHDPTVPEAPFGCSGRFDATGPALGTTAPVTYVACSAGFSEAASDLVNAGDSLYFEVISGQTLRILDAGSNSIIGTVTVQ